MEASHSQTEPTGADAKALGAYYTDSQIADFLARWAIRDPSNSVMDPCFGGGVFLRSACQRLIELEGDPRKLVFGVELDGAVHLRVAGDLDRDFSLPLKNLRHGDFFEFEVSKTKRVDAIIGNPPFIRYQRFRGPLRQRALRQSRASGVQLPELCSSWAPFLVHCIAMLRDGGRLAMVVPMEIGHAKYAQPLLDFIRQSFRTAVFLTFRERLFPKLSEDTLLLIADFKGEGPCEFSIRDFKRLAQLDPLFRSETASKARFRRIHSGAIASGKSRLVEYLIPAAARSLYRRLHKSGNAQRLGCLAKVGIGYVTGANDFFHLTPNDARSRGMPSAFLKPAVKRARAFGGLRFDKDDWAKAAANGDAGLLLHIPKNAELPPCIDAYVQSGLTQRIDRAYKCRTRTPWFCVPHVHRADAFLTYMSGWSPSLVANHADAYAPNTLLLLQMHPLQRLPADALAALWQTSLTRLSVEIEGHALGGGMLKLEPTEAESVLIALPSDVQVPRLLELAAELHQLFRQGKQQQARMLADEVILIQMAGLDRHDCMLLSSASNELRSRRGYRETPNGAT